MVKVYSRSTCGPCKQLKQYLNIKQINFDEVDLDQHPECEAEVVELTGFLQVPTTVINGHAVSGYNLMAISKLIQNV